MVEAVLDREDLKTLIFGSTPTFEVLQHSFIADKGIYDNDFEIWQWNVDTLDKCTDEELWEIYSMCKRSKLDM